jgi:hypothetical protein
MIWKMEVPHTLGDLRSDPREPEDRETAEEQPSAGVLTEKLLRLAELQEELRELDRVPGLAAAVSAGGADVPEPLPAPLWQARMGEIEAEIEQLRTEIAAEEPDTSPDPPRAAEEVGRRILEQIGDARDEDDV